MHKSIKIKTGILAIYIIACLVIIVGATQRIGLDKEMQDNTPVNQSKYNSTNADCNAVKLKFTYWGDYNEKKLIENACNQFMEYYPGIIVQPLQIGDYSNVLLNISSDDEMPDIGYMSDGMGQKWALEGKFVNLFDMLKKDHDLKKDDFIDFMWVKLNPDNAWGLASGGESFGLYFNKDLLKNAGIESLPSKAEDALSWDQFVEIAKKLTIDKNGRNASQEGFDPNNIKQYGIMFDSWYSPTISNFVINNGGKMLSDDGSKCMICEPEAVEAIQKMSDLINVYHVAPTPDACKSLPSLSEAFQAKIAATMICGQWVSSQLSYGIVNYDIGVLPKLKKSLTVQYSGYNVIFNSSKHKEEAWLLFKWLCNPEHSIELYSGGLWMPTIKKWYTDPEYIKRWVDANPMVHPPGFKDAMMKQLLYNGYPFRGSYMDEPNNDLYNATLGLNDVWNGKKTAHEVLCEQKGLNNVPK